MSVPFAEWSYDLVEVQQKCRASMVGSEPPVHPWSPAAERLGENPDGAGGGNAATAETSSPPTGDWGGTSGASFLASQQATGDVQISLDKIIAMLEAQQDLLSNLSLRLGALEEAVMALPRRREPEGVSQEF